MLPRHRSCSSHPIPPDGVTASSPHSSWNLTKQNALRIQKGLDSSKRVFEDVFPNSTWGISTLYHRVVLGPPSYKQSYSYNYPSPGKKELVTVGEVTVNRVNKVNRCMAEYMTSSTWIHHVSTSCFIWDPCCGLFQPL